MKESSPGEDLELVGWGSGKADLGDIDPGVIRFARYQKGGFSLDGHWLERSGFFARWDLYICSMFLAAELSGFGLNIEQEVKIRGTANTVVKITFLLIGHSDGSPCIWSKRISILNYLLNLVLDNIKLLDNNFIYSNMITFLKQNHLRFSGSFCPQPC